MKASISQLATMTGMDRRTVTARLRSLEGDNQGKAGIFFDTAEALPAIYGTGSTGEQLDPRTERAKLDHAKRVHQELVNAERRQELISLESVYRVIDGAVTACREGLQGIPGRFASILAAESDAAEIERILDVEIRRALEHISDMKECPAIKQ